MTRQDNIIIWCLGVLDMTKTLFGHDKRYLHSVTFLLFNAYMQLMLKYVLCKLYF